MIIFFYGENDFKLNKKAIKLQDRFIKEVDPQSNNIFKFSGDDINLNDLLAQIKTTSLFSDRKMMVISNLLELKNKKILTELQKKLDDGYLEKSNDIFLFIEKNLKKKPKQGFTKIISGKEMILNSEEKKFFQTLDQQKFSQEFKNFSPTELNEFIRSEFQKVGLQITSRAQRLLLEANANNIWQLYNEIKKLIYFKIKDQDKTIQEKDLKELSSEPFNEDIFDLSDAISQKNIKQSIKILEKLRLSGLELPFILRMLIRHFKILWQIRQLLDQNYNSQRIIANLKLHPFVINKGINQAKHFEAQKIKEIFNNLSEIDKSTRQSDTNPWLSLNTLLLQL